MADFHCAASSTPLALDIVGADLVGFKQLVPLPLYMPLSSADKHGFMRTMQHGLLPSGYPSNSTRRSNISAVAELPRWPASGGLTSGNACVERRRQTT